MNTNQSKRKEEFNLDKPAPNEAYGILISSVGVECEIYGNTVTSKPKELEEKDFIPNQLLR